MCPSTCNVLNLVDKPNQKRKCSITSTNSSVWRTFESSSELFLDNNVKIFKMPGLGSIIPINWWIPATFNACSKPDPAFSTVYVVVFFVFSEFSEGEKRVVAISCVDERHCLILISDICALFWEMREHNKSVIESHIWKNDRKYNGRMTDNAVEWWQTKQWHNLIVTVVISNKLCPLNFEKSLKIPKSNQNLHVEEE